MYIPDTEVELLAVQLTGGYIVDAAISHKDLSDWRCQASDMNLYIGDREL